MSLEECVKTEPEWGDYGVSEAAVSACLYEGHRVKDELVIGPELLQPRDIAYTIGVARDESWLKICNQELASDQRDLMTCEQWPTIESQTPAPPALWDCFVSLERIILDKAFDYKPKVQRVTEEDKPRNKNDQNGGEVKKNKTYMCDICSKQFLNRKSMIRHIRIHTKEKLYICDTCSKQFLDRKTFIKHIRVHTGLKPYSCEICERKFACTKYLAKHKLIHKDHRFSCGICEKKFTLKGSLKKHKLTHTEGNRLSCEICSKKLASQNSLDRHKLIHTGERPFSCGICEKEIRHKSVLVIHMRKHEQETYECEQKFMSDKNPYNNKQQLQQPGNMSSKLNYKETCDICKKQVFSWCLTAHKRFHTKPFQCEVCEKKYGDKRSLLSHYTVHTGVISRDKAISRDKVISRDKAASCDKVCGTCKMKFTTTNKLRNHKRNRHAVPHSCEICNKQFNRKDSFVNHKLIHTGETPFPCEICKKQFRLKSSLTKHLPIHDESCKYSCQICGYKTTSSNRLSIHKRKHTGEKPFACDICEKRFSHKSSITDHMRIHTGEKPYGCGTCGKRFRTNSNFNKHRQAHASETKD